MNRQFCDCQMQVALGCGFKDFPAHFGRFAHTFTAPRLEHSRLISPKCNSAELKYVYGESCLYSRPMRGSRNKTHPHPYGCKPCLCGSITMESAFPIWSKASLASLSRFCARAKYPP